MPIPAPRRPRSTRNIVAGLLTGGALLAGLTGCHAAAAAQAAAPGTAPPAAARSGANQAAARSGPATAAAQSSAATAAATAAVTAAAHIAPGYQFGNGTVYDAWITSATPGSPARVTLEMAWHYAGRAAAAYARAHGLPAPPDDHIDIDRNLRAAVTVSPALRAAVNPQGAGPQQLTAPAFVAWARQHPAVNAGGGWGGPLYAVTFHDGVLVSAQQISEP